ncbi:MAG: hypothetical protein QNK11_06825 [Legionella sp.]|nr:hypothetical protein [Legionella sp.]
MGANGSVLFLSDKDLLGLPDGKELRLAHANILRLADGETLQLANGYTLILAEDHPANHLFSTKKPAKVTFKEPDKITCACLNPFGYFNKKIAPEPNKEDKQDEPAEKTTLCTIS